MSGSTVDVLKSTSVQVVGDLPAAPQEEAPKLQQWHYFPSVLYTIDRPEFLDTVKSVSNEYLASIQQSAAINDLYPAWQTIGFQNDARIANFVRFIGTTSWDILAGQGFNMTPFHTTITELWCQEHHKYSGQDEHMHGHGNQISGFYFLDVPEDAPRAAIHDPRPAKIYANLPEANMSNATYASVSINFLPKPGQFMFMNSWLPHSFTKNPSMEHFKFVHFNVSVIPAPPQTQAQNTPPQAIVV
jgi:hypothetical protein